MSINIAYKFKKSQANLQRETSQSPDYTRNELNKFRTNGAQNKDEKKLSNSKNSTGKHTGNFSSKRSFITQNPGSSSLQKQKSFTNGSYEEQQKYNYKPLYQNIHNMNEEKFKQKNVEDNNCQNENKIYSLSNLGLNDRPKKQISIAPFFQDPEQLNIICGYNTKYIRQEKFENESEDENVSDDEIEKTDRQIQDTKNTKVICSTQKQQKITFPVPNIQILNCGINQNKQQAHYKFSKNVDYERLTDRQKRKYLKERKGSKNKLQYTSSQNKIHQIVPHQPNQDKYQSQQIQNEKQEIRQTKNKENATQGILKIKSQKQIISVNQQPFGQLNTNTVIFNQNTQYQSFRDASKTNRPDSQKNDSSSSKKINIKSQKNIQYNLAQKNQQQFDNKVYNVQKQSVKNLNIKPFQVNDQKQIAGLQIKAIGSQSERESKNNYISNRIASLSNRAHGFNIAKKSHSRENSKKKSDKKLNDKNALNYTSSNQSIKVYNAVIKNVSSPQNNQGIQRFFNNFSNKNGYNNTQRQTLQQNMTLKNQNAQEIKNDKIKQKIEKKIKPTVYIDLFKDENILDSNQQSTQNDQTQENIIQINEKQQKSDSRSQSHESETDKITQRNSCNIKESQIPMERTNFFNEAYNHQSQVPENHNENVNIWIFKPEAPWQDQSKISTVNEDTKQTLGLEKQRSMPYQDMTNQLGKDNGLIKLGMISQILDGDKNSCDKMIETASRQESLDQCLYMLKSDQSIQQNEQNDTDETLSDQKNTIPSEITREKSQNSYFKDRKKSSLLQSNFHSSTGKKNQSSQLISDEKNTKNKNISNINFQAQHSFGGNISNLNQKENNNLQKYLCDSYEDEEVEVELQQIPNEKQACKQTLNTISSSNEITHFNHRDYLLTKENLTSTIQASQIQQSNANLRSQVQKEINLQSEVIDFAQVLNNDKEGKYIQQQQNTKDCSKTQREYADEQESIMENTANEPDLKSPEFGCQKSINHENVKLSKHFELQSQDYQINFDSILEQKNILYKLKELLEIRPKVIQEYSNLKKSFTQQMNNLSFIEQIPASQAIEGLSHDDRVKIQQLCQDWWDQTQEDKSIFNMALQYQQHVQENYFRSSIHDQQLQKEEMDLYNQQNYERSQCMRKSVVLQSVVIGMTAFFSMLQMKNIPSILGSQSKIIGLSESTVKKDLELRSKISQLIKIIYDQFMLCQSYLLGKLSTFENCTQNQKSAEYKLYQSYSEHIHLLFINKKIQSEQDYLIFNNKNSIAQFPPSAYIVNEENRDYQISQLSKRLKENIYKILEKEIETQNQNGNQGNAELLCVIRDICNHSAEIDFQEGKNHIFEGISTSEVMPNSNNDESEEQNDNLMILDNQDARENSKLLVIDMDQDSKISENSQSKVDDQKDRNAIKEMKQVQEHYGANLIKTFNNDINQVIQEESREESMSISMMNASRMDDFNQKSHSINKSKLNAFAKMCSPGAVSLACNENPTSQTLNSKESQELDFYKVQEIQESEESENDAIKSLRKNKNLKVKQI